MGIEKHAPAPRSKQTGRRRHRPEPSPSPAEQENDNGALHREDNPMIPTVMMPDALVAQTLRLAAQHIRRTY